MIDIASRRVVGFALAEHLRTELVADALTNAVAARDPAPGVVFHADRGCQYLAIRYTDRLAEVGAVTSVGSRGDSYDTQRAGRELLLEPEGGAHLPHDLPHQRGG